MDAKAIFDALQKHIKDKDDVEMVLLKGHLIVEQAINELLSIHIHSEEKLNSLQLMFAKKLDLLSALQGEQEFLDEQIPKLKELNRIRNKLAHKLDFDEYHDDLKRWACSVIGDTPATINRQATYRNTVIKAFYFMAAMLGGFAAGAKAANEEI